MNRTAWKLRWTVSSASLGLLGCEDITQGPQTASNIEAATQAIAYTVTDLGVLGCPFVFVQDINNRGQVVGGSCFDAFLWQDGVMSRLETLGGRTAYVNAINERGEMMGTSSVGGGVFHPAYWYGSQVEDLGTLGGAQGEGLAINNSGVLAGGAQVSPNSDLHQGVLWDRDHVAHNVGGLAGPDAHSAIYDINGRGVAVGHSDNASGNLRAFRLERGSMTDLGTLGGLNSEATGINDAGTIVGRAETGETVVFEDGSVANVVHAFVWRQGQMTDLPLDGSVFSGAEAINNRGQIVGGTDSGAVLWQSDGSIVYLNSFLTQEQLDAGLLLFAATSINDRGQVVAFGVSVEPPGDISFRSFIISPAPGRSATLASNSSAYRHVSRPEIPEALIERAPIRVQKWLRLHRAN